MNIERLTRLRDYLETKLDDDTFDFENILNKVNEFLVNFESESNHSFGIKRDPTDYYVIDDKIRRFYDLCQWEFEFLFSKKWIIEFPEYTKKQQRKHLLARLKYMIAHKQSPPVFSDKRNNHRYYPIDIRPMNEVLKENMRK